MMAKGPMMISVVGCKRCGKTTLIEGLLPALARRGLRVGTIKHDTHGFEFDRPGKDTYRHFAAGAEAVLIAGPGKLALQRRMSGPMDLDGLAAKYLADLDLVLTEGYLSGDKPKIEVVRRETGERLCGVGDNLAAIVSDMELAAEVPVFGLNDVEAVAEFIVTAIMKRSPREEKNEPG
jgi:molybdopterin-guanine dinucleotide biosynthesis adapter protein